MTSQPYVFPDVSSEHQPPAPVKQKWPLSVWILPDGIFALIATLILSVIVMIAYIAVQVGGGANLQELFGPNGTSIPSGLLFGLLVAQNLGFVGIVLLRTRLIRKLPLQWLGLTAPQPLRLIGWGIIFGILFVSLNFLIGLIFSYFGINSDQADLFQMEQGDTLGQTLMFLGAVVAAPIGEELFFRGYAFKALRENSSRRTIAVIAIQLLVVIGLPLLGLLAFSAYTWSDVSLLVVSLIAALGLSALVPSTRVRAYLISSAFFAVVHLSGINQGAIALLAATFIGGLCLAGAYDRTGSILPSIIAHAINNSVAFGQLIYCVNAYGSVQNCG
ncbi:MAG: CPBP family intramembrane metalloprotease [Chloroflexi bacterium]|nr:CPBP family intramembrane metalloprotease [Chloroflexota bacterium]